jgi:hypothetical protein
MEQAIASLLLQLGVQLMQSVNWAELFASGPTVPAKLETVADLKVWLCQQAASGAIAPSDLANALTLLCQLEGDRPIPTAWQKHAAALQRVK